MLNSQALFAITVVALVGLGSLSGCEHEGPAERAGKSIDQAAERTGDKVEQAGESLRDKARD